LVAVSVLAFLVVLGTLAVNNLMIGHAKTQAEANFQTAEQQRLRAEENAQAAQRQRDRAEENFQKAMQAVDLMLTRVSEDRDRLRYEPGMEPVRRQLLQDALAFYQGFLQEKSDDPAVRRGTVDAYARLGIIQEMLDENAAAEQAFGRAIVLLREL